MYVEGHGLLSAGNVLLAQADFPRQGLLLHAVVDLH